MAVALPRMFGRGWSPFAQKQRPLQLCSGPTTAAAAARARAGFVGELGRGVGNARELEFQLRPGRALVDGLHGGKRLSTTTIKRRRRRGRSRNAAGVNVEAISSTGPYVNDNDGDREGALRPQEAREGKNSDDIAKKKRLIAGIDQTQLLDPHLLADPDSRFEEFYGVKIHHKIARPATFSEMNASSPSSPSHSPPSSPPPTSTTPPLENASTSSAPLSSFSEEESGADDKLKVNLPAILLHGFGASSFSWERVMPKLAALLGAPVLAFDRPAFGFTARSIPSPSSPPAEQVKKKFGNFYSVAYSAAAALGFIDLLQSDQAILIGHSAGSLVAVESYFQSPERIAALVLVAPALMAPLVLSRMAETENTRKAAEAEGEVKRKNGGNFLASVWKGLLWLWLKFKDFLSVLRQTAVLVMGKILGVLFRSPIAVWLVRRVMDKGGPWAVRYAFYDVEKADKYVLDGYTKPLQCRDWERALLEYFLSTMHKTDDQVSRGGKLEDVKCPVLVVTGDTDRIVPAWNSERLANIFPCAEFKRISKCGHLPQEETPEELLKIIKDWLARTMKTKVLSGATFAVGHT